MSGSRLFRRSAPAAPCTAAALFRPAPARAAGALPVRIGSAVSRTGPFVAGSPVLQERKDREAYVGTS